MSNSLCVHLYGKTMSQPLPAKELTAFKSLLKLLDQKQYKKALKSIEGILKKCPDHGETLAMKAFTIRSQDPEKQKAKDESHEIIKKGIAKDVRSHLCWHVYALLSQMDRHWTEAVKCYRLALRADEKNVRMLRELASLLIQVRDTAAYVEVRQKLFNLEPGNRVNWIALAVAHYLHGEFEATLKMLEAYEKATADAPVESHVRSEFQLFKNTVVERAKSAEEAVAHLEQVASHIPDKLTFKERKVELCLKAGKQDEAEKLYRELLELNPENYNYYAGLRKAMGLVPAAGTHSLSAEQVSKLQTTFAELQKLYPRANAPSRIALDFLEGEAFSAELANYVRPRLRSGKPSLFSELKSLYARADDQTTFEHPDKVSRIEQQFEGYLTSLRAHKKFDAAAEASEESPSTVVFTLHFAAQHFDAKRDHARALELIEEAIAHTPTLINLYVAKARIYKHAGSHAEAAARMEVARKLDLADRYLNTVSTKYQLRAGNKEQAEATVSLFTKWDASGQSNLFEMQASWYELALAAAHRRAGDLPNAITQYGNVVKHFHDFDEDQLDFHAYCVRKQTLRAYLDLLRWEDNVHSHRFYYRAATNLVECYLEWLQEQDRLREKSSAKAPVDDSEEAKARRKEESKKRRFEAKLRAEQPAQPPAEEAKDEKPSHNAPTDMTKIDALAEATKLVRILEKSNADKLHTHVLAVQVYLRAGQYSAALSALKKATELQPNHPDVHRSLIRFFHHAASAQLSAEVKKEVDEASGALLGGQTVEQANEAFLAKHSGSLAHLLAAADMKVLVAGPQKKQEAAALLRADAAATLSELEAAHQALQNKFEDAAAADAFQQKAHQRFPLASAFAPQAETVAQ